MCMCVCLTMVCILWMCLFVCVCNKTLTKSKIKQSPNNKGYKGRHIATLNDIHTHTEEPHTHSHAQQTCGLVSLSVAAIVVFLRFIKHCVHVYVCLCAVGCYFIWKALTRKQIFVVYE